MGRKAIICCLTICFHGWKYPNKCLFGNPGVRRLRGEFNNVPNNVNLYIFYWLKTSSFYVLWNVMLHKTIGMGFDCTEVLGPVVFGHVGFSWMKV